MPSPTTRPLTRRYVVALATVAVLAAVGQGLIQGVLVAQAEDGRVINLAGRQRMLSQRTAKEALAAAAADDPAVRAAHAAELRAAVSTLARTQRGLRWGDPGLGLPGQNSADVAAQFDALAPDAARLVGSAERVLAALDANAGGAALDGALADLLAAERAYLPQMNAIVFQYDAEAAAAVRWLRAVEAGLFGLTLVVLLVEGLWVFRPVVGRVREAFGQLEAANDELSEANAALVAARDGAGAAERAKASILANMSHEVRTPLTGILGYAELLRAEAGDRHGDLVEPIERGARRLLGALDAIIQLARLEGTASLADGARADAAAVATDVVALFRPQAEAKGLALDLVAAPGSAVRAERAALSRALANVVDNAVRFTERGRVTVTVRERGGAVEVRVEDTGVGMDAAFVPRAFEAFEQASTGHGRSHEGVGLGLAVTGRLLAAMGGRATAESEPGRGTAVTLWLPAAPPAAPDGDGAAPSETAAPPAPAARRAAGRSLVGV